jgi:hypothetical protein
VVIVLAAIDLRRLDRLDEFELCGWRTKRLTIFWTDATLRTVVIKSTARAGKHPWNPKEPKMIARKQLLTIALILGGLGLIGVFAISTNTSGIIFLPR